MAKIKIDTDALKSNAASLEGRIAELQSLNTRMETLIARIRATWEGKASDAYIAKITAEANKAKQMVAVLEEYKKYVESAVSKFSAIDAGAASRINNSF